MGTLDKFDREIGYYKVMEGQSWRRVRYLSYSHHQQKQVGKVEKEKREAFERVLRMSDVAHDLLKALMRGEREAGVLRVVMFMTGVLGDV